MLVNLNAACTIEWDSLNIAMHRIQRSKISFGLGVEYNSKDILKIESIEFKTNIVQYV